MRVSAAYAAVKTRGGEGEIGLVPGKYAGNHLGRYLSPSIYRVYKTYYHT